VGQDAPPYRDFTGSNTDYSLLHKILYWHGHKISAVFKVVDGACYKLDYADFASLEAALMRL